MMDLTGLLILFFAGLSLLVFGIGLSCYVLIKKRIIKYRWQLVVLYIAGLEALPIYWIYQSIQSGKECVEKYGYVDDSCSGGLGGLLALIVYLSMMIAALVGGPLIAFDLAERWLPKPPKELSK